MSKEKKKQASVLSLVNASIFLLLFAPIVLCEVVSTLQYIFDYSLVPYGYDACISVMAVVVLIQVFVMVRYVIRWRQHVLFFKRRWDERSRINQMQEKAVQEEEPHESYLDYLDSPESNQQTHQ